MQEAQLDSPLCASRGRSRGLGIVPLCQFRCWCWTLWLCSRLAVVGWRVVGWRWPDVTVVAVVAAIELLRRSVELRCVGRWTLELVMDVKESGSF